MSNWITNLNPHFDDKADRIGLSGVIGVSIWDKRPEEVTLRDCVTFAEEHDLSVLRADIWFPKSEANRIKTYVVIFILCGFARNDIISSGDTLSWLSSKHKEMLSAYSIKVTKDRRLRQQQEILRDVEDELAHERGEIY